MATYIWVYIWAPLNCLDYHNFIVKIWNQEVFQEYLGYSSSFSFPYTFLLKLVRLGGKKDLYWYFDWDTWFSVNIHDHESQGGLFWNPAIILHFLTWRKETRPEALSTVSLISFRPELSHTFIPKQMKRRIGFLTNFKSIRIRWVEYGWLFQNKRSLPTSWTNKFF